MVSLREVSYLFGVLQHTASRVMGYASDHNGPKWVCWKAEQDWCRDG